MDGARLLPTVSEAARQRREGAECTGIAVRIVPDMPNVEGVAAAIELCLANYIPHAIKYSDPSQPMRVDYTSWTV